MHQWKKNIPALVVIPDNYAQRALHLNTILILHVHGYLPIRNPELFSSASSMSGGVDLRHSTKRWGIAQKLGPYKKFPHHWVHALDYHLYYLQHQFKYQ